MTYKLIKKYPGSPEVGTLIHYDQNGYYNQKDIGNTILRRELVENQDEFWEKVPEKQYEILSFIRTGSSNHNGAIFTLSGNTYSTSCFHNNLSLEHCLTSGGFLIQSVKRLSDGKVFSVGDTVKGDLSGKITRFEIESLSDSGMTVYSDNMLVAGYNNCCLSYIKHSKIIFTTQDGVEIAEGDTVDVYAYAKTHGTKISKYTKPNVDKNSFSSAVYYFCNFNTAKKRLMHSLKCLSIEDVISIFPVSGYQLDKLTKLAEEKANIVVNE